MDITLMYTPEEKKAFEEEHITYRKHQDKRKAEEAAMDPKRFEALFHSEDEKKVP